MLSPGVSGCYNVSRMRDLQRVSPATPVHPGRRSSAGQEQGQALVMVTIGIVFIMGLLGLVTDVGWGYYRKQVAQAAVDAAVLAAVQQASVTGSSSTIVCGSDGIVCQG